MDFKKLLAILLLALAFSACDLKENMDRCPAQYSVELQFTYDDDPAANFTDYIEKVDVGFYDESGNFLMRKSADKQELLEYQGMKVSLSPGKYYIVSWGNVLDNTGYGNFTTQTKAFGNYLI